MKNLNMTIYEDIDKLKSDMNKIKEVDQKIDQLDEDFKNYTQKIEGEVHNIVKNMDFNLDDNFLFKIRENSINEEGLDDKELENLSNAKKM